MNLTPLKTKEYIKTNLLDERLKAAVDKATQNAITKRNDKVDHIPYWEELRYKMHHIKRRTLENLDTHLIEFEKNCQKNNIHVHWAVDGQEANRIVLDLARKNNCKTVVKSKSLTTEEINLNSFLIDQQLEVLETDLGEYIVQLLGQIPSHLTAPALHLNRTDIGKLFHEKFGGTYTENPEELMQIARARLRRKFMAADMGISGANFAISSAGCFGVVENEGNARLSIGLAKIHVAVMGIEKILPDFEALACMLKLLPASSTGQKATVYVDIVGGPLFEQLQEGPSEVHIVLLDNGRSKILADPQLRESLFCIRCGACLNICPIYQQVGGHAYGWVYMGPIGAILIPQYLGLAVGRYAPFVSSLCGACYQTCPVRINIPHHLLKLRNRVVDGGYSMKLEKLGMKGFAFLAGHPGLYRFATWFPGKLQLLLPGKMAFPVPGYFKKRALGRFDVKGFRKRYNNDIQK
jgi:L-lactate dehydrogenase complex protein LldF